MKDNRFLLSLLLSVLAFLLFGCAAPQEVGTTKELTVQAGKHPFRPHSKNAYTDHTFAYRFAFDASMQYELGDVDQCDWNKLTGANFPNGQPWDIFDNHQNSLMVGWLWNPDGYFELAAYYHKNGQVFYGDPAVNCGGVSAYQVDPDIPVAVLYPGQTVDIHFNILNDTSQPWGWVAVTIIPEDSQGVYFQEYFGTRVLAKWYEIGPWFGGNRTAPHDMSMTRTALERF